MKVKEYTTVCEMQIYDFDLRINNLISKGYELYGDPYSISDSDGTSALCQALTRKEN